MTVKKKSAFIFRGSPASGKTTTTKNFVEMLSGKTVLLELDTFRWGFHLHNRDVEDVTQEEHQFAYENFLLILEQYCKNGDYTIVVEGLFSWDTPSAHGNIQDIVHILKKYEFDYTLFLLSGDYEMLWTRNTKRDYVVPESEFRSLYDHVMQKISDEEVHLDVCKLTPEEVSNILRRLLE